ncbi:HNH endonuclease [Corynebacterium sanguinis]|uniref:HNH endonuclease signature motif containing protein n=1 Tax=Corynebacterium TaxID=1716 RepID=UPI00223B460D|nr:MULTISPECIES: HNH endonuclease signature motif containing protein [Corynebacterium]MCT1584526.1 HNH endonuclease [Corynebacterium sanguinis]MCT1663333.1 HNH endonuclease [Corynebacterium sanguinis]MCT1805226.1 HNH endonuclease [Corynebacterium sanguinis]MCT2022796.1 HNH endonuclease [Corynebacterium sanguinis]MCT2046764.1 HNH endonuclease [Corynebacterium sanguinis]
METTTPDNHRAAGPQLIIEGEYLVFSEYSEDHANSIDRDLDIEIAELMALTRRGKTFVESGIFGYSRLRDLPRLRALHATLKLLDVPRLAAIDKTLRVLPADTAPETFALFDDALVSMFTRAGTTLPSLWSITRRLRRLIAEIDTSVNFDPKRRKKREESTAPNATFHPVSTGSGERSALTLTADTATMAAVGSFIRATAKEHKLGLADSIIELLTGSLNPAPAPVLHIFTPGRDGARVPGSSAYLPGFGWTDADATAVLEDLLEFFPPTTTNLDDVRAESVDRYSPTAEMADYVRARDGTRIFPGCHTPADKCQLDHRIPFNGGGKTTPENLFCLCQHHHNVKTDRRAFYIPDPDTGDTLWIFANRTWLTSESNGILAGQINPSSPRWRSTPASSHAARSRVARFNAQCHTLCDAYDVDGDYDACVNAIRELEQEYGLVFEFHPEPEDLSWIPPEPPYEEYG